MAETDGKIISVLIAHPDTMVSELIASALNREPSFRVTAWVSSAPEVLEMIRRVNVDVALISVDLHDGPLSSFRLVRELRECRPHIRTVMLLDGQEPQLIVDAFRAGGRGVFSPTLSEFKMLCRCVEQVYAGQIWANSSELGHLADALVQRGPLRVVNSEGVRLLTKREEDVVRLLAEGMGNRDIARELSLSESTVRNYMFHIFDKLGVSNRVELLLYSINSTRRAQTGAARSPEQRERADEDSNCRKSALVEMDA